MVLEKISYKENKRKHALNVRKVNSFLGKCLGLMFKKNSPPLLFIFKKEKKLEIHSFFCKPFTAIWLDKNFNVTKKEDVNSWKPSIKGHGKYLLEIPLKRN